MKVPISVIIPTYNNERFIRQAIESVHAQTVQVSEIVVVDNNCTDRTRQIAEEMGARIVEAKKQNIAAARNRGIIESRCEWVALLDSDDVWKKRKIEYQWEAIRSCPDAGMISCDFNFLEQDKDLMLMPRSHRKRWAGAANRVIINRYCSYFPVSDMDLLRRFSVHTSTVILRRDVFSEIGFFDEDLSPQEDVEFFLRVLGSYPLAVVHRQLSFYRRHENNTTKNREAVENAVFRIAERMAKSPDKYPDGIAPHYLENVKKLFVRRGKRLAREQKQFTGL